MRKAWKRKKKEDHHKEIVVLLMMIGLTGLFFLSVSDTSVQTFSYVGDFLAGDSITGAAIGLFTDSNDDDLVDFFEDFGEGLDNTTRWYNSSSLASVHFVTNGIMINTSLTNDAGDVSVVTAHNVTVHSFNMTANITVQNLSSTFSVDSSTAVHVAAFNQSNLQQKTSCSVNLEDPDETGGYYVLYFSNSTTSGPPPTIISTSLDDLGANITGLLKMNYDNETKVVNCSFFSGGDMLSVKGVSNDVAQDFGVGIFAELAYAGAGDPTGDLNTTIHSFNYSLAPVEEAPPANSLPLLGSIDLNTTDLSNDTNQNLTANAVHFDDDSDGVKIIYNWLLNGSSQLLLNTPFEGDNENEAINTTDYAYYNNGSVYGATWDPSTGFDGNGSYDFNGSTDWINFSDNTRYEPTENFSIEVWVNPSGNGSSTGSGGEPRSIISKGGGFSAGYSLELNTNEISTISFYTGSGGSSDIEGSLTAPDNVWTHVVAVYNGTNASLWINGVLDTAIPRTGAFTYDTSALEVGRATGTSGQEAYFNGSIDDLRIWNRSLTGEQILALFNNKTNLIVAKETTSGQNWTVDLTPHDGSAAGGTNRSNQVITVPVSVAENNPPLLGDIDLSSTDLSNDTNQNISVSSEPSDADGDTVKTIYNWLLNTSSQLLLNAPFEANNENEAINATDYAYWSNGSVYGATWSGTSGFDGNGSYDFNGSTDWINFSDNTRYEPTENFSIEVWVKPDGNGSESSGGGVPRGILNKDAGFTAGYGLEISTNDLSTILFYTGSLGANDIESTGTAPDNVWTHIVAVYNSTNASVWINGVLDTAIARTGAFTYGTGSLEVGRSTGTTNQENYFNGSMDELRIWNRSLSGEQILALFTNRTDLIVAKETTSGQNWTVDVTPNDGTQDGGTNRSNQLITVPAAPPNNPPILGAINLNTTNITSNSTNQNLTIYATPSDADSDGVKIIYNWLVNSSSQTVLNIPFESNGGNEGINTTDYSGRSINGSVNSSIWNSTGGVDKNGSYVFNGINASIKFPDRTEFELVDNITIEGWVKHEGNSTDGITPRAGGFIQKDDGIGAGWSITVGTDDNATIVFQISVDSLPVTHTSTGNVSPNAWTHIVARYNRTNVSIFINGVEDTIFAFNDTMTYDTGQLQIGQDGPDGFAAFFNGSMDEIRIWNRSLSNEQISAIFNNKTNVIVSQETTGNQNWTVDVTPNDGTQDGGTNRSNQVIIVPAAATDTAAPLVEFIAPTNGSNYSNLDTNVLFNVSVLEENNDSVIFIFNNATGTAFNKTGYNASGYWNTTLDMSSLVEGAHTVVIHANDTSGNENNSVNLSFTKDSSAPTVTWTNPTNVSNYTVSTGNVSFNITVNDLTAQTVLFSFDNSTGNTFNATAINDSGTWYANVNVSGLVEGTTTVTIIANDTLGQINNTEQIIIIVDNTAPTVTWSTPNNNTNYSLSYGNVSFNITVNEANFVRELLFSFDNATGNAFNVTGTNDSGTWYANVNVSGLTEGLNTITVFANDSSGNVNNSIQVSLTADFTAPTVTLVTPSNSSNFSKTSYNQTFNVSVGDLTSNSVIFRFDTETETLFDVTAENKSGYWSASYNVSSLANGTYTVTIIANDSASNQNQSQIIKFYVDKEAPIVTIHEPVAPANTSLLEINFTTHEFAVCLWKNSTGSYTNFNRTETSSHYQNVTDLSPTSQIYSFSCNDTLNNKINFTFPILVTTQNYTNLSRKTLNFSGNTTDTVTTLPNFNITLNLSGTYVSNFSLAVTEYNLTPETVSLTISGETVTEFRYYVIEAPDITEQINKLTFKITYNETLVTNAGIAEADLEVFYYNLSSETWVPETEYAVDTDNNFVEVNVTHLSTFVLGKSAVVAGDSSSSNTGSPGGGGSSSGAGAASPSSTPTPSTPSTPSAPSAPSAPSTPPAPSAPSTPTTAATAPSRGNIAGFAFFNKAGEFTKNNAGLVLGFFTIIVISLGATISIPRIRRRRKMKQTQRYSIVSDKPIEPIMEIQDQSSKDDSKLDQQFKRVEELIDKIGETDEHAPIAARYHAAASRFRKEAAIESRQRSPTTTILAEPKRHETLRTELDDIHNELATLREPVKKSRIITSSPVMGHVDVKNRDKELREVQRKLAEKKAEMKEMPKPTIDPARDIDIQSKLQELGHRNKPRIINSVRPTTGHTKFEDTTLMNKKINQLQSTETNTPPKAEQRVAKPGKELQELEEEIRKLSEKLR